MHDLQCLVGQCHQRVHIGPDETDFDGCIHSRRQFEEARTGDGIRKVGFHVTVELFFILFGILAVVQFHQYIGKVRLRPYGGRRQVVTQRSASEGDRYFFHFRQFLQMGFHFLHLPCHVVHPISVRIKHVGAEVGLVQ